jgi:tetratricopeptide (TPR) repeat protein
VLLIGFKEARFAEGHRWAELARGALEHLGSSPADEVELLEQESVVFYEEKRLDEGAELLRRSLALREKHPSSSDAGENLQLLGYTLISHERLDEALALYKRALSLKEAEVGPEHPEVAAIQNNIGYVLWAQGDFAGSLAAQQRALDIRSKLREGSVEVGKSLVHRGNVLRALGRIGEALADHRKALSIFEAERLEADRPLVTWAIEHVGRDLHAAGRYDEAERALREGRARVVGRKDPDEESVASFDAVLGGVALGRGDARLAATRLASALPTLERKSSPNLVIAEARFWLAQALEGAGRDRGKARALAEQARGTYATLAGRTRERAAIDAWLGKLAKK